MARFLNTTIFDPQFTDAWGDAHLRPLMIQVYKDAEDEDPERVMVKMLAWVANILSYSWTSLFKSGYFKAKFKNGQSIGAMLSPFRGKADAKVRSEETKAQKEADKKLNLQRITGAWFGQAGLDLINNDEADN